MIYTLRMLLCLSFCFLTGDSVPKLSLKLNHPVIHSKATQQTVSNVYLAPAGNKEAIVDPSGTTVLPNGKLITPKGQRLYTGYDLWDALISPNGNQLIGISDGQITSFTLGKREVHPYKEIAPSGIYLPGGELLVSNGEDGGVSLIDTKNWQVLRKISLNEGAYKDAYIVDVLLTKDGKTLYALDVANQTLDVIEFPTGKLVTRVPCGREPYAFGISQDQKQIFVVNIGLFNYSVLTKSISHPAFGFPSNESKQGVNFEGTNVPGLGNLGTADGQSIWSFDISTPNQPHLKFKKVSGILINAPTQGGVAIGGSAPNAIVLSKTEIFIANANNDTIQFFRQKDLKLEKTVFLAPTSDFKRLRGVIPTGEAVSADGRTLFVCESGINSVALIDIPSGKVKGMIPTGWFPLKVRINPLDPSTLYVATQKGVGEGPIGYLNPRPQSDERYGLGNHPGMIERITLPNPEELAKDTHAVLVNNGLLPVRAPAPVFPPQIKHVVYIIKENHTFDGIFGGLPGANGQPKYAEFGMNGWIREKGTTQKLPIMPNHIKIAEQFAISDNFYLEPHYSGDGHRWIVGVYPSLWTTRLYYAGWNFKPNNLAKGRLVSFDSNASQIPEDYLENGSIWENLERGKVPFRNYGEGFEFPGVDEGPPSSRTGAREVVNIPMPKALFQNTCFEFPIFNTNIPDIAKVDWFEEDIQKNFRDLAKPIPAFMDVALSNDHGDTPRPKNGYPYMSSYLADDDLAVGKLIEYLSHTPEWKSMAIFITQDDPGGDNDHVERHRSFVLAISPYVKHGYVSHVHSSIMSIVRSIYQIFRLNPSNLFDATATPLTDMFTNVPDFTPYEHVEVDPRVFKPSDTFDPDDPEFKKRRTERSVSMDDPAFIDSLRKGFRAPESASSAAMKGSSHK